MRADGLEPFVAESAELRKECVAAKAALKTARADTLRAVLDLFIQHKQEVGYQWKIPEFGNGYQNALGAMEQEIRTQLREVEHDETNR